LTLAGSGGIISFVDGATEQSIHVGLNAHLLSLGSGYRSAGMTWYIYNLLAHLPEADRGIRYTAFLSEKDYGGSPGLKLQRSRLPTDRPAVRIVWEQLIQPSVARRAGLDLIHGLAFVGPMGSGCPFTVTVHDLSFLFYPQGFRTLNRLYLRLFARLSARRARRVIAVSESTKRDVVEQYGVAPEKVDVVYNGVDPVFRPLPADQVSAFRAHRGLPDHFILFVGTLEPRKNIARLLQAYAQLPGARPPFMFVGGKGWFYDEIFTLVERLELGTEVHFVGYVPADDLPMWYNAADLFVYPSLYEGFGLPPLEAMACGTPVVTSTASSLPEVVGQAALLVDPADTGALARAIERGLADADLRAQMRAEGLARVAGFSWRETARRTADSYRQALFGGGGGRGDV
jgi:glycosyltransferase involved in cell wall biosynthesis